MSEEENNDQGEKYNCKPKDDVIFAVENENVNTTIIEQDSTDRPIEHLSEAKVNVENKYEEKNVALEIDSVAAAAVTVAADNKNSPTRLKYLLVSTVVRKTVVFK